MPANRLILTSNRLPIVLSHDVTGRWQIEPGSGGLVTALAPVLRDRGGIWIGWAGIIDEGNGEIEKLLNQAARNSGYIIKSVPLIAEERDKFYYGFANEILWPILHDLQTLCNFDPHYWKTYQRVNRKFAGVIAQNSRKEDYIWVHDYQLMCVAQALRELSVHSPLGFFLHTPFPALDMFLKLPWALEILRALLQYDLIGLQTLRDRRNFIQCVEHIIPDAPIAEEGQMIMIDIGKRKVNVGSFPISIDFRDFESKAASKEVYEKSLRLHRDLPGHQIILGVDRLDYTKGIPYRLQALKNALERFPDLHEKVSLVQIVVPSRENISRYQDLKCEIERMVGEINGRFTRPGWAPIHYVFRSLERAELLAYYRMAEIALITPLKDGMNLVAKEYCASTVDENGVLILSEFAGAAAQLQESAILVNPYDIEGVADAIHQAAKMDPKERVQRMRKLRRSIQQYDIFWWVDFFLRAAFSKDLGHFPVLKDYVPQLQIP
ncbi:MAG: trehalose-6-phosphate synthase [Acidobacteria bacterium]|nr:trehalose-6-phosphate synthase [Acidobacteriota bacterium]